MVLVIDRYKSGNTPTVSSRATVTDVWPLKQPHIYRPSQKNTYPTAAAAVNMVCKTPYTEPEKYSTATEATRATCRYTV